MFEKYKDWQKGAIIGMIWGIISTPYAIGESLCYSFTLINIILLPLHISLCLLYPFIKFIFVHVVIVYIFIGLIGAIIGAIIGHLFGKPIKKMLK